MMQCPVFIFHNKVQFMKKILLFLFGSFAALQAKSQTFTVVNNSKATLYYHVTGSDKNACTGKYTSMVAMINPGVTTVYGKNAEMQWNGEKPGPVFDYMSFNANYTHPSGACIAAATNAIGECSLSKEATINTAECENGVSVVKLTWSSRNGNVLVTIN